MDVAQRLAARAKRPELEGLLEVLEALLLALVAVTTAWSGYQAALWGSQAATDAGRAASLGISAQGAETRGGQEVLYDTVTFDAWLQAQGSDNAKLAALIERRFRPEFKNAFVVWKTTDPLDNTDAPSSPLATAAYDNASMDEAATLQQQQAAMSRAAATARDNADRYVRETVLLSFVLFLAALSQRFKVRAVRTAIVGTASVVLVLCIGVLVVLPIA